MQLLPESLALAHYAQRVQSAERNERQRRLVAGLRAQRRAERAARHARRLLQH